MSLRGPSGAFRRLAAALLFWAWILPLTGCDRDSSHDQPPITVGMIEQSPQTFTDQGQITGIDVDIARAAAAGAGIDLTFEMKGSAAAALEWIAAGPNRALLGIAYSKERSDLYQWAGPISKSGYYLFVSKESGVASSLSLAEAQRLPSIAVVDAWQETLSLAALGFTNLRHYPSYEAAFGAFTRGETTALASDLMQLAYKVRGSYKVGIDLLPCFSYKSAYYFMAFSPDVDDRVVAALQKSLTGLIRGQVTLDITKKYFPTAIRQIIPDTLQLLTEAAPPYSYATGPANNYMASGSSVDVVNEIQRRTGYVASISLTGWQDGYATVGYLPDSALFTTFRTPEREELFRWVGPISTARVSFYTLTGAPAITSLADARNLPSVATPAGWYTFDYLVDQGFNNVAGTATTPEQALRQLLDGEVTAAFLQEDTVTWLCTAANGCADRVVRQFRADDLTQEGWIAFNRATAPALISDWQSRLDGMKQDGTFDVIMTRWYGSP